MDALGANAQPIREVDSRAIVCSQTGRATDPPIANASN